MVVRFFINSRLENKKKKEPVFKQHGEILKKSYILKFDKRVCPPLQIAVIEGNENIVDFLSNSIVSTEGVEETCTYLMEAGWYLHYAEVVEKLLKIFESKPDKMQEFIKIRDGTNYTALHYACKQGNDKIVDKLLKPFDDEKEREKLQALIKMANIWCLSDPFWWNYENDDYMFLQLEKEDGYIITITKDCNEDFGGYTALHFACKYGHDMIVDKLLKLFEGETEKETLQNFIKVKSNDGYTALLLASRSGRDAIVDKLLRPFEGVTEEKKLRELMKNKSSEGYTPLQLSSWKGYDEIVSKLLGYFKGVTQIGELQKYIKVKSNEGYTALHLSCVMNRLSIIC